MDSQGSLSGRCSQMSWTPSGSDQINPETVRYQPLAAVMTPHTHDGSSDVMLKLMCLAYAQSPVSSAETFSY